MIKLTNVAKFYEGLPNQITALEILEIELQKKCPELLSNDAEWVKIWRTPDPSKAPSQGDKNLQAFLMLIRFCEGTLGERGYKTIFTYQYFDSFADHPRRICCSGDLCSDAAGAYQFLSTTWDSVANQLGLRDFSPKNQDIAAIELIRRRGVLQAVRDGKLWQALQQTSWEWASMPPSRYGQPNHTYETCEKKFVEYGGLLG